MHCNHNSGFLNYNVYEHNDSRLLVLCLPGFVFLQKKDFICKMVNDIYPAIGKPQKKMGRQRIKFQFLPIIC